MSFATDLAEYPASHIIAATGCPRGTAYDWKDGRREPPAWQQPYWLSIIRKTHNKTSLLTDTRPAVQREGG
jgi:hypothetical protein